MKRVVVTGMGAITPIGNSVDEFWAAVKKQTVGIGEITKMDATDYKVKLALLENSDFYSVLSGKLHWGVPLKYNY